MITRLDWDINTGYTHRSVGLGHQHNRNSIHNTSNKGKALMQLLHTSPTNVAVVDAKSALNAKHTASRTKLASHAQRAKDVPVNFSFKLTKDRAVRYQSLELAGWYQTVPYLRLRSQMR
jgi:hypothetical protein